MKKSKKIILPIICVILAAVIGVGIYFIVSNNNSADSPEKAAMGFLNAVADGNIKKAMHYSAFDYEDYIKDAYSEDNIKLLISENVKGIGDQFATPDDFYAYQSQIYGVSINSGGDMYNAMLTEMSTKSTIKTIEVTNTTDLDLNADETKELLNFYQNYNFTGLEAKDYYDIDKISQAVDVEYKYTLEDGSDYTATLTVVKADGEWGAVFNLSDLTQTAQSTNQ